MAGIGYSSRSSAQAKKESASSMVNMTVQIMELHLDASAIP